MGEGLEIGAEGAEFGLDFAEDFCVANHGGDFAAVADDFRVFEERRDFSVVVGADFLEVEIVEGFLNFGAFV